MNTLLKNSGGKLYIEKRTPLEWLAFLVVLLPFGFGLLEEIFGIPNFIRFSLDMILICLCVLTLFGKYVFIKKETRALAVLVLLFFAYTFITYCFNFQSPFYYLWGLRNNFRFYIAFFIFVVYIKEETAYGLLKILDALFWINFVVSLIQFFFMNVRQDDLGGIFGTSGGTNGYTLLFFCVVISRALLKAFNNGGENLQCVFKIIASLLVAAMAEMKFYFFVFIILLVLAAFLTSFSKRKFALVLISCVGVIVGSLVLSFLFEEFENFLSVQSLFDNAVKENYSSARDINRLSGIFTLSQKYVTGIGERLFGMGLGNCDTSSVSVFNSVFYQNHSYLHYTWFSSAMLFLEIGFIGLIFYFSYFIICFVGARKKIKKRSGNKLFCQMAIIMSIMCCIITVYNSSLRIESGYIAYFILALPFVANSDSQQNTYQ